MTFNVVILGGGLVGALAALQFANKGYKVQVFEKRSDIRKRKQAEGRSINLALSVRGISALKNANIDKEVLEHVIPMKGRFIHLDNGTCSTQPYGLHGEAINSVDRKLINEILLNAAEKSPKVTLEFGWGLERIDFEKNIITVGNGKDQKLITDADLIIGADGAFSRTRQQIMRHVRMDFEQKYIDHAYCELSMPPSATGEYQMDPDHLHIWPRKTFMMIALPNLDKSFTVTLFMPWDTFNSIKNENDLMVFFETYFSDAIPLIGKDRLVHDFFHNENGSLMTVKCKPYHVKGKAVIVGDAAHAMVPFYGQGMNCGFEDILVLDEIFSKFVAKGDSPTPAQMETILKEYTETRNPDVEAMCDLALYNYVEMRDSVTRPSYLFRKKVEGFLHRFFPTRIIPLYTMVSFSRIPYKESLDRFNNQTKYFDFAYGLYKWGTLATITGLVLYKFPTIRSSFVKLLE